MEVSLKEIRKKLVEDLKLYFSHLLQCGLRVIVRMRAAQLGDVTKAKKRESDSRKGGVEAPRSVGKDC